MTALLTIGVVLAVTALVSWLVAALIQSGRDEHAAGEARRNASATALVPGSKPILFTEFGCPAADKGDNQPN